MKHVGIDLGARSSQVCIVEGGKVIEEWKVRTRDLPRWLLLQSEEHRVVMESCAESAAIATAAEQACHDVCVIAGTKARMVGVGARNKKNDRRDARALAMYSYRVAEPDSVHLKSDGARAAKRLVSVRTLLVKQRTALTNQVKSRLREQLLPTGARFSGAFTDRVREQLLQAAKSESEQSVELELAVAVLLDTIDVLSDKIKVLEDEIARLGKANPWVRLLTTVPGVGLLTAMLFVATTDTTKRFDRSDKMAEYLGLTPGEATTGFKPRPLGITKAGPKLLRALLIQCAWSMQRSRPDDPAVQWAQRIAKRRNKRVATVALARKLATIMFAMLRDGRPYDPKSAAAVELEHAA